MNTEDIEGLLRDCAALDGVWADLMACYGDADAGLDAAEWGSNDSVVLS